MPETAVVVEAGYPLGRGGSCRGVGVDATKDDDAAVLARDVGVAAAEDEVRENGWKVVLLVVFPLLESVGRNVPAEVDLV